MTNPKNTNLYAEIKSIKKIEELEVLAQQDRQTLEKYDLKAVLVQLQEGRKNENVDASELNKREKFQLNEKTLNSPEFIERLNTILAFALKGAENAMYEADFSSDIKIVNFINQWSVGNQVEKTNLDKNIKKSLGFIREIAKMNNDSAVFIIQFLKLAISSIVFVHVAKEKKEREKIDNKQKINEQSSDSNEDTEETEEKEDENPAQELFNDAKKKLEDTSPLGLLKNFKESLVSIKKDAENGIKNLWNSDLMKENPTLKPIFAIAGLALVSIVTYKAINKVFFSPADDKKKTTMKPLLGVLALFLAGKVAWNQVEKFLLPESWMSEEAREALKRAKKLKEQAEEKVKKVKETVEGLKNKKEKFIQEAVEQKEQWKKDFPWAGEILDKIASNSVIENVYLTMGTTVAITGGVALSKYFFRMGATVALGKIFSLPIAILRKAVGGVLRHKFLFSMTGLLGLFITMGIFSKEERVEKCKDIISNFINNKNIDFNKYYEGFKSSLGANDTLVEEKDKPAVYKSLDHVKYFVLKLDLEENESNLMKIKIREELLDLIHSEQNQLAVAEIGESVGVEFRTIYQMAKILNMNIAYNQETKKIKIESVEFPLSLKNNPEERTVPDAIKFEAYNLWYSVLRPWKNSFFNVYGNQLDNLRGKIGDEFDEFLDFLYIESAEDFLATINNNKSTIFAGGVASVAVYMVAPKILGFIAGKLKRFLGTKLFNPTFWKAAAATTAGVATYKYVFNNETFDTLNLNTLLNVIDSFIFNFDNYHSSFNNVQLVYYANNFGNSVVPVFFQNLLDMRFQTEILQPTEARMNLIGLAGIKDYIIKNKKLNSEDLADFNKIYDQLSESLKTQSSGKTSSKGYDPLLWSELLVFFKIADLDFKIKDDAESSKKYKTNMFIFEVENWKLILKNNPDRNSKTIGEIEKETLNILSESFTLDTTTRARGIMFVENTLQNYVSNLGNDNKEKLEEVQVIRQKIHFISKNIKLLSNTFDANEKKNINLKINEAWKFLLENLSKEKGFDFFLYNQNSDAGDLYIFSYLNDDGNREEEVIGMNLDADFTVIKKMHDKKTESFLKFYSKSHENESNKTLMDLLVYYQGEEHKEVRKKIREYLARGEGGNSFIEFWKILKLVFTVDNSTTVNIKNGVVFIVNSFGDFAVGLCGGIARTEIESNLLTEIASDGIAAVATWKLMKYFGGRVLSFSPVRFIGGTVDGLASYAPGYSNAKLGFSKVYRGVANIERAALGVSYYFNVLRYGPIMGTKIYNMKVEIERMTNNLADIIKNNESTIDINELKEKLKEAKENLKTTEKNVKNKKPKSKIKPKKPSVKKPPINPKTRIIAGASSLAFGALAYFSYEGFREELKNANKTNNEELKKIRYRKSALHGANAIFAVGESALMFTRYAKNAAAISGVGLIIAGGIESALAYNNELDKRKQTANDIENTETGIMNEIVLTCGSSAVSDVVTYFHEEGESEDKKRKKVELSRRKILWTALFLRKSQELQYMISNNDEYKKIFTSKFFLEEKDKNLPEEKIILINIIKYIDFQLEYVKKKTNSVFLPQNFSEGIGLVRSANIFALNFMRVKMQSNITFDDFSDNYNLENKEENHENPFSKNLPLEHVLFALAIKYGFEPLDQENIETELYEFFSLENSSMETFGFYVEKDKQIFINGSLLNGKIKIPDHLKEEFKNNPEKKSQFLYRQLLASLNLQNKIGNLISTSIIGFSFSEEEYKKRTKKRGDNVIEILSSSSEFYQNQTLDAFYNSVIFELEDEKNEINFLDYLKLLDFNSNFYKLQFYRNQKTGDMHPRTIKQSGHFIVSKKLIKDNYGEDLNKFSEELKNKLFLARIKKSKREILKIISDKKINLTKGKLELTFFGNLEFDSDESFWDTDLDYKSKHFEKLSKNEKLKLLKIINKY